MKLMTEEQEVIVTPKRYLTAICKVLLIREEIQNDEILASLIDTMCLFVTEAKITTIRALCVDISIEREEMLKTYSEDNDWDNITSDSVYYEICITMINLYCKLNLVEAKKHFPEFGMLSDKILAKCDMSHPKDEEGRGKFKRLFGLAFAAGYLAFLRIDHEI